MEVIAKKFDRFGWDRDMGTAAHDRIVTDWMDALQDYPLDEIRSACRSAIITNPNRMPNEGHILAEISKARRAVVAARPKVAEEEPPRERVSAEAAAAILEQAGFTPKRFGGDV